MKKRMVDLENQIALQNADLNKISNNSNQKEEQLNNDITDYINQINELKNEMDVLNNIITNLTEEKENNAIKISSLLHENEKLKQNIKNNNNSQNNENEKMNNKKYEEIILKLKKNMLSLKEENKSLEEIILKQESEVSQLSSKVIEVQKVLIQKDKELQESIEYSAKLTSSINFHKNEIIKIKQKQSQNEVNKTDKNSEIIMNLQKELQNMKKNLEMKENKLNILSGNNKNLQDKLNKLTQIIKNELNMNNGNTNHKINNNANTKYSNKNKSNIHSSYKNYYTNKMSISKPQSQLKNKTTRVSVPLNSISSNLPKNINVINNNIENYKENIKNIGNNKNTQYKRQNIEDTMRKIGGLENEVIMPVKSPEILHYRHKIQYPVSETKNSKRILAGYFKPKSHEIVNIKYCPVQPAICDEIVEFIREKAFDYGISGFNEKKHSGDLRHIVLRVSADNGKILVTLVINSTKVFPRLKDFCEAIFNEFELVTGVCINFNPKKTNVILGDKTECVAGKDYIIERILGKTFKIGANTFFQINPKSAENIFAHVKNHIAKNFDCPTILDAYSGVSAFGITVSDVAKEVVCVEENREACELAHEIERENKVKNIEINNMDAEVFFKREKRKFDIVILDPPRSGCTEASLDNALKVCAKEIIYVSCNPATLARDLKYLTSKGAKVIGAIQPFDMFCHTYHIENVAIIKVPSL